MFGYFNNNVRKFIEEFGLLP